MDMTGQQTIPAPRETVWEALNDPDVLKECIPGCEEIEPTGENGFTAKVSAKVGPVKAKFSGAVELQNLNPPESYTIMGEGKGGAAGFAKGSADVKLEEAEGGAATVLTYNVKASVGGKLAQIGGRLIDSTAKKYANDFFDKFTEIASARAEAGGAPAAAEAVPSESKPSESKPAESTPAKTTPVETKKESAAVADSADTRSEEMKRLGVPAENVYDSLHWAAAAAWIALAVSSVVLVVYA
ncbi:MAG: carbon monoxide dehydrogenase subunit G [Thalassobaculaceae bacterium]